MMKRTWVAAGVGAGLITARKTIPATNLNELIAWLKANPGKASAGIDVAGGRLLTVAFQKETNTQFTVVAAEPCLC
jgi:tripartite-type tricarboxylate transporter receptor subunit TctC